MFAQQAPAVLLRRAAFLRDWRLSGAVLIGSEPRAASLACLRDSPARERRRANRGPQRRSDWSVWHLTLFPTALGNKARRVCKAGGADLTGGDPGAAAAARRIAPGATRVRTLTPGPHSASQFRTLTVRDEFAAARGGCGGEPRTAMKGYRNEERSKTCSRKLAGDHTGIATGGEGAKSR